MFANGSYATIWEIKKEETNYIDVQISTSKKVNGAYEQDFGGIVRFVGDAKNVVASKKPKDRIKIVECGVSNKYSKEKKTTYWNPVVFKCEDVGGAVTQAKQTAAKASDTQEDMMGDELPF